MKKRHNRCSLYLILILLVTANDVQLNPGPNSTTYNCGTCDLPVTWEDKAIMRDTCNQWYHITCQSVHSKTYNELANNSAIAWDCIVCNNPNYSSVCFDLILSTTNQYSIFSDETSFSSPTKTDNVKPIHASTPIRNSSTKGRIKRAPIKILNINCQSIKIKQCRLNNLLNSTKPDVVICTETWIYPSIADNQIFPDNYNIYSKDRKTTGGGVLIAISKEYLSESVPEYDTECEIVWAKIRLINSKDLYIAAFYNPKTSNEQPLDELEKILNRFSRNANSNPIVAGDFNLPGWEWKTKTLKENTPYPKNHSKFIEILDDNSLIQMVEEPTRGENTLS